MGELLQVGLFQFQSLKEIQGAKSVSIPRGKGLMVAIDIFDRAGNLDSELRDRIINQAFLRGLLLLGCGKAAIRFCPPLVIDSDQIQVALEILVQSLVDVNTPIRNS